MFYIYKNNYNDNPKKSIEYSIWVLAVIRIILCFLPQNKWITNDGSSSIGIIRNIPFIFMGLMIIVLYFQKKDEDIVLKNIWLYVLLSFLFYIPVVVGASLVPMLGMFMLPKTVCYVLIILCFKNKVKNLS